MCAIIGALTGEIKSEERLKATNAILNYIFLKSYERGRDGRGFVFSDDTHIINESRSITRLEHGEEQTFITDFCSNSIFLSNLRAEPTTEYISEKSENDQQPYKQGNWTIVHNGTIANDKKLRTYNHKSLIDSAAIAEHLSEGWNEAGNYTSVFDYFSKKISDLKGSYAIIAKNDIFPNKLFLAANYRPVWYIKTSLGIFFASSSEYFPESFTPIMVNPYSAMEFSYTDDGLTIKEKSLLKSPEKFRALVVCSGGLDSVVAATQVKKVLDYETELIHFLYGSRAEGPEVEAVKKVAEALDVKYTIFPLPVYKPSDSPLLQVDSELAGGEEGAEFAHEWVPARNLLLLSVATAYAEANNFDVIVLGNNLEEAGAYPDNEPEFISRFNKLLPFAVGDGKSIRVIMPVGNLMKHEIVALGNEIGAPMNKTWSCYRAGEKHCGKCGPCFMRRTAFKINNIPEVIEYTN